MCVCAAAGVKGRTISLKLKRRKTNAPDPPKFMGHGDCNNMSRSITLSRFTDSPGELASQGKALLKALDVNPTQIRGIGLNVSLSPFCSLLQAHKFRLVSHKLVKTPRLSAPHACACQCTFPCAVSAHQLG